MSDHLTRRSALIGSATLLLAGTARGATSSTEIWSPPKWRPSFVAPLHKIADCFRLYIEDLHDFAVFAHGTCTIVEPGLSDAAMRRAARVALRRTYDAHPYSFGGMRTDDGDVLVPFDERSFSVVLTRFAKAHWREIEANQVSALTLDKRAQDDVDWRPSWRGDGEKIALYGRACMFVDGRELRVARIERRGRGPRPPRHNGRCRHLVRSATELR